ncbi:MAG: Crp/Fnr family transcriptional regulator [Deltaproteobacteria bacterium]|nr:Crp/Fnr family transcriptional regulator [Deltaproteobacteria bacterium]
MECSDFIGQLEVFRGLAKPELMLIEPCCLVKKFKQEDRLFREDEEAKYLWGIISGKVDLRFDLPARETEEALTISRIEEGGIFGWSSMIPPFFYRLSAYCVSKGLEVIQIERACLTKVFEAEPRIGYLVMSNIAQVIAARFQALQDELAFREGSELLFKSDW